MTNVSEDWDEEAYWAHFEKRAARRALEGACVCLSSASECQCFIDPLGYGDYGPVPRPGEAA